MRAMRNEPLLAEDVIVKRVDACERALRELREGLIASGIQTPREAGRKAPVIPGDDRALQSYLVGRVLQETASPQTR